MTIDYDIVIIGGTAAGRYAALYASQLQATVALVETQPSYDLIEHNVLSHIGKRLDQHTDLPGLCSDQPISVDLQKAIFYGIGVVGNVEEQQSLGTLASQGVDVIVGDGEFQASPHLTFAINKRLLRARTYLLATGSRPAIPNIEGLETVGYLTLDNIWHTLSQTQLPKNWVILGGVPQSIQLAQTLRRLGCEVTLVVASACVFVFPSADPELVMLLQAQLESEGIRVITHTKVTQVRRIEDKKWLQAGDRAIETDEIVVATAQQPNVESLNLPAVGIKWEQHRLMVNGKLQTTNRRIYACGDVIGGYDYPNAANYEAKIALKNALFFPHRRVNYRSIPWAIFSDPMLAQVGLTAAQGKKRYGKDGILVLQRHFKALAAAQIEDGTTGVCKLIVRPNGEILGASILGSQAGELINLISLAIAQKIKVKDLASLSPIYPSFSEIWQQTAIMWEQQRLSGNDFLQELLQDFYQCRRNWNF